MYYLSELFFLNSTVAHFQKYAFILYVLNTEIFSLPYRMFSQVTLYLSILFIYPWILQSVVIKLLAPEVHLVSPRWLSWSSLFSQGCITSHSNFRSLIFSLKVLTMYLKFLPGAFSFNIFSIPLILSLLTSFYQLHCNIWTRYISWAQLWSQQGTGKRYASKQQGLEVFAFQY